MSQVNEPKFKVIESHRNIEIREYEPLFVAEVKVAGERKELKNAFFCFSDEENSFLSSSYM